MEQKDLTTFQSDINNIFVDTPEKDIPETLRDSIFLDAKKDPAFKRLFGDARLICDFLNAVLHLDNDERIMNVEILDKDIALIQASDELFSVDVRARNGMNQYFDIEIQGRNHGSFYDKAKKTLGKEARYKMPHIICIWLCNFPHEDNGENYREEWGVYRKNDIGKKNALPVSDVIKYIFIKLPRVNFFKESIQPEELAWYDLIANSEKQREIPETASDPIRDAYERLRVRRTPKLILERQARDMIPSAMIDDLIDEAVDAKMRKLADDLLAMGKLTDDEISAVSGIPKEKLRENKG